MVNSGAEQMHDMCSLKQ